MPRRLLLLVFLATLPAHAMLQLRPDWTKLMQMSPNQQTAQQIAANAGGFIVWTYPLQILMYVPDASVPGAIAEGTAKGQQIIAQPKNESIALGGGPIDPLTGVPPAVEHEPPYAPGSYGLYIVQYVGPLDTNWFRGLGPQPIPRNAFITVMTPEQAADLAAQPYVQFVDRMHPFEKNFRAEDFAAGVRYEVYVAMRVAPGSEIERAEVRALAERVNTENFNSSAGYFSIRVTGENLHQIVLNPLVDSIEPHGAALPHVIAVYPRHATAGHSIIVSGEGLTSTSDVSFDGVSSPRVEVLGDDRLRVEVPPGLPSQPVDLLVTLRNGDRQLAPAAFAGSGSDDPLQFRSGDVFAADDILCPFFEGFCGATLRWLTPSLQLNVQRLDGNFGGTTVFFDRYGLLSVAYPTSVRTFDASGNVIGSGPSFANAAIAVRYDRNGNAVVVTRTSWARYDASGQQLATNTIASPAYGADLGSDGCTLLIADHDGIAGWNVCLNQPLPRVWSGSPSTAMRVLPDDSMLIVTDDGMTRIYASGGSSITPISGYGGTLALSPDGMTAYLARAGHILTYDVLTSTFGPPLAAVQGGTYGLAVYGEWFAARGTSAYLPAPVRRRGL